MKTIIHINAPVLMENEFGNIVLTILKSIPIMKQGNNTLKLVTSIAIKYNDPTINIFNRFLRVQNFKGICCYIIDLDQ